MKIISLNCNHCGAPLDVPAKAKFVTCGFCSCRLQVRHTGNTYSTAAIEQLVEQTNRIQDDVNDLKRRAAIADLDERWRNQKSGLLVRNKQGRESVPTVIGTVIPGIMCVGFTLFFTAVFGPLAFLVGLFCCAQIAMQIRKASTYSRAKQRYERQRRLLASRGDGVNYPANSGQHRAWN